MRATPAAVAWVLVEGTWADRHAALLTTPMD